MATTNSWPSGLSLNSESPALPEEANETKQIRVPLSCGSLPQRGSVSGGLTI